jgi:hypothetical protein
MSVEADVLEASQLLRNAYEQSECKWCARNLLKLSEIAQDLSTVLPYTSETAKRIGSSTEDEIREVGGKVAVLRSVVLEANHAKATPVSAESINIPLEYKQNRGIPMDKKTVAYTVGSQLAFGTGLGFVMNRVDGIYTTKYAGQSIGTLVNLGGGLLLVVMGAMGWGIKSSTAQMVEVIGGGAMLQNGALALLENVYAGMATAGRPAAKSYLPVNARSSKARPGQMNPIRVNIDSF